MGVETRDWPEFEKFLIKVVLMDSHLGMEGVNQVN